MMPPPLHGWLNKKTEIFAVSVFFVKQSNPNEAKQFKNNIIVALQWHNNAALLSKGVTNNQSYSNGMEIQCDSNYYKKTTTFIVEINVFCMNNTLFIISA